MRSRRRLLALVVSVVALSPVAQAAAAQRLVVYNFQAGLAAAAASNAGSPPGANDYACRPSTAHPRPVVLVHGTFENQANNWNALSPLLTNNGYCVFSLNYGGLLLGQIGATGEIGLSAGELAAFVDRVLAATKAAKVDIVGHSQGAMMPRYYLKNLGGAGKVHALVGLSPSNHGTTLDGIATLAGAFPQGDQALAGTCSACTEQLQGSDFLSALNAGGDTVPGVTYTVITTRFDEVVTPFTSAFLSGPAVTNIVVQDQCRLDAVDHTAIPYDHVALRDVLNALDPAHAAGTACTPVAPGVGG